MKNRYILITPAKDEEKYIETTIKSIVSQTVAPLKWIIVSDGSTDKTNDIVKSYTGKYPFIQLLGLPPRKERNFGAQARAFNKGYELVKNLDFDFIGNLDADISYDPDYMEKILKKFEENGKLGLAGGFIYEKDRGVFKNRSVNRTWSIANAVQLFRKQCFEEIGGYQPIKYGGHDWVAETKARIKGWEAQSFPELKVYHHRRTNAAEGSALGPLYRQGKMDYTLGSHPLFEIVKCFRRFYVRPYIFSTFARLCGFTVAAIKHEERAVSPEFMEYLKKEQLGRLKFFKVY